MSGSVPASVPPLGVRGADVPLVDACREKPMSESVYAVSNWQAWPETYRRFVGASAACHTEQRR